MENDFENAILLLNVLINQYVVTQLQPVHNEIQAKYKADKYSSDVQKEFSKEINNATKVILTYLSKKYRKLLLDNFLTNDGLTFYVYSTIRQSIYFRDDVESS